MLAQGGAGVGGSTGRVPHGRESADRGLLATARQALQASTEAPAGEVLSGTERVLSLKPLQGWLESPDVFACSRKLAAERRALKWPKIEDVSLNLLGQNACHVVLECIWPLRKDWKRQVLRALGACTHWTRSYREKWEIINHVFDGHALRAAREKERLGRRPFFRAASSKHS